MPANLLPDPFHDFHFILFGLHMFSIRFFSCDPVLSLELALMPVTCFSTTIRLELVSLMGSTKHLMLLYVLRFRGARLPSAVMSC